MYIVSIITMYDCYDHHETMLIPKVIGKFKNGFKRVFKYLKTLPLGHRFRGDVGTK